MADETAAAQVVEDDTTFVPEFAPTQAAPTELAWSAADADELQLPGSWRPVFRNALAVFSTCVAIAGAVTAVDRHWFAELRQAAAPVAVAASTVTVAPPVEVAATTEAAARPLPSVPAAEHLVPPAPRDIAVPPVETYNPDVFYLNTLRSYGIVITNPYVAIEAAHTTCSYLRAGHSPMESAIVAMQNNATLSLGDAKAYVISATAAYCPDVAPR